MAAEQAAGGLPIGCCADCEGCFGRNLRCCVQCGLSFVCPQCGSRVDPRHNFCDGTPLNLGIGVCGHRMNPDAPLHMILRRIANLTVRTVIELVREIQNNGDINGARKSLTLTRTRCDVVNVVTADEAGTMLIYCSTVSDEDNTIRIRMEDMLEELNWYHPTIEVHRAAAAKMLCGLQAVLSERCQVASSARRGERAISERHESRRARLQSRLVHVAARRKERGVQAPSAKGS